MIPWAPSPICSAPITVNCRCSKSEVDLLFDLIAMRLVTSVTISAERRPRVDGNPYLSISEKPAWDMLRRWRRIDPHIATRDPAPGLRLRRGAGCGEGRRLARAATASP